MRLIDADELLKNLMEKIPMAENVHIFRDIINNQLTAYDLDKVVDQLEKELELADKEKRTMRKRKSTAIRFCKRVFNRHI